MFTSVCAVTEKRTIVCVKVGSESVCMCIGERRRGRGGGEREG